MSRCHGAGAAPAGTLAEAPGAEGPAGAPIVLVGNPNVGKSTLFNALTGAHQHVGNWPGKTVRVARGTWRAPDGARLALADLPGLYSLLADAPDEELVRDLLTAPDGDRPALVVFALDAANPARNLFLLSQVLDTGIPLVVALTMTDVAARRGTRPDPTALAEALGPPVVPVEPRTGTGLDRLAGAVRDRLAASPGPVPPELPEPPEPSAAPWAADGPLAAELTALARDCARDTPAPARIRPTLSDRADRLLLSRWFGVPFFLAVMWGVFQATTTLAEPLQDGLGALVSGPVSGAADGLLDALRAPSWLMGLLVDGLIGGVGQLLTFLPLMAIMFLLLSLLEDSGYFARAAFLADRLMRTLRLPGRAFLPLVVGFGCNVPALAGTRILRHRPHRLLVGMLVPFMSCTARLAVYVMIAGVFFGGASGTVVFLLYVASVLPAVGMVLLLRPLLFRDMTEEPLVLELPPYRMPTPKVTGTQVRLKLTAFLRTAGGIIVATAAAVWLLAAVPAGGGAGSFGRVDTADSAFGRITEALAPVAAPPASGTGTPPPPSPPASSPRKESSRPWARPTRPTPGRPTGRGPERPGRIRRPSRPACTPPSPPPPVAIPRRPPSPSSSSCSPTRRAWPPSPPSAPRSAPGSPWWVSVSNWPSPGSSPPPSSS
ncbi:ferrous iron transporter B [Streptomyces sp. NPDC097619]|uniref:ferrous iron transporter B n=1 Tax=Streptomyces sp. NPDC097619 TaxID=3157228 RepID=UPI00332E37DC